MFLRLLSISHWQLGIQRALFFVKPILTCCSKLVMLLNKTTFGCPDHFWFKWILHFVNRLSFSSESKLCLIFHITGVFLLRNWLNTVAAIFPWYIHPWMISGCNSLVTFYSWVIVGNPGIFPFIPATINGICKTQSSKKRIQSRIAKYTPG